MAGIGVKLTNIYKKNTLTTDIIGMGYSMAVTIAPMLVVIGALVIMEYCLDFSSVDYLTRELFSCTVLYIFFFTADGIPVQLGTVQIHVGYHLRGAI